MTEALSLFERLGAYILTWSWQMAVLVAIAWMAVKLDRQHRPTLRHRLWVMTLLFSLLLPWIPEKIAAQYWTQQVRQVLLTPVTTSSKPVVQVAEKAFAVSSGVVDGVQAAGVPQAGVTAFARWNFLQVTGFLWVAGVGFAAFRRAREHWRLRRIASSAAAISAAALTPDADALTPPILLSPEVRSPMLYGWFHPVILLPEDVSKWSTPDERGTMIRHEAAHHARKDHWISAFDTLIRTVFFFHPLVRWTCRQVDIERELACDEEVLRRGAEPAIYAEAILKVAEHALGGRALCGVHFAGTARLDHRVDMLFRTPPRVIRSAVLLLPVVVLLAPMAALGFWQTRIKIPAPIEFRIQVNPVGLIPEEILAPAPTPVSIAAVISPVGRPQDPLANPAVPATSMASRVNVAFIKINRAEVMVNLTLGLLNSQLTFKEDTIVNQMPVWRASGRVEAQITDLAGTVITSIQEPFEVMTLAKDLNPTGIQVYQKSFVLLPGPYRMVILVADSNGGTLGTVDTRLEVPRFPPDKLSASSFILADLVELVPPGSTANFRIGSLKVRPNMSELGRDRDLNIFQQVYVSAAEARSVLPVYMETLITREGREITRLSEALERSANLTITKKLPLADFAPGAYAVQTTYTDAATGERVVSTGQFTVR